RCLHHGTLWESSWEKEASPTGLLEFEMWMEKVALTCKSFVGGTMGYCLNRSGGSSLQ
ncbi:hypothetical protein QTP70_018024, partial [Hemibagrus guttatus]